MRNVVTRALGAVVIGAVVLAGAAACGGDRSASDDKKSHSASKSHDDATGSSSPNPADSKTPGPSSSDGGGKAGEKLTLSGTVKHGPEEGCVLLKYQGTTYRLIGSEAQKLDSGDKVKVTGEIASNSMSTCQTGTPFKVKTAKVIG